MSAVPPPPGDHPDPSSSTTAPWKGWPSLVRAAPVSKPGPMSTCQPRHRSPRRFTGAQLPAGSSQPPRSSGNATGAYQCRTGTRPPSVGAAALTGSSQPPSPRIASSAATSRGEATSSAQCAASPGGVTSSTRRDPPEGHVSGRSRLADASPDSAAMDGASSSLAICAISDSIVAGSTARRIVTQPSRAKAARRRSA